MASMGGNCIPVSATVWVPEREGEEQNTPPVTHHQSSAATTCNLRASESPKTVLSASSSSTRLTTWDIQRDHEKMLRSQNVKERIGPIVDRLKTSLSKIEAIEDSMELPQHCTLMTPGKSKELMHGSIELVKRKLLRLRKMEEMLAISEDRRHNLQHHVLQVSLSKPRLELAATKRQNFHLLNQVDELQQQNEILNEKSLLADDLQHQNDSLLIKIDELLQLQDQLEQTRWERDNLKEDLMDRQAKISQQADKCDDLECQVEQMKVLCDELMSSLKRQEDRNAVLEQELIETRRGARRERLRPPIVHLLERKESMITDVTSSSLSEATNREDDNSFDSSFSMSSASAIVLNSSGLDDDRACSRLASQLINRTKKEAGLEEDTQSSMLETLMATIDVLDRENAQLREEKYRAVGKCNAQIHEMQRQADIIRDLKLRFKKAETLIVMETGDVGLPIITENGPSGEQEKKGSFFQRLLSN
jgi:hypothetical protein